ncbi:MAG TPA: TlpA disulfide reductase family protein [Actinomycetota bacterium]
MAPRRHTLRTATAAVALALVVVACSAGDDEPTPPVSLPSTPDTLPATTVDQFDGLLRQLEGTPVVVNLWASWCVPCEAETPKLVEAAAEHPDIQFLGVNSQDARDSAEAFIATHGMTYPSVFDPDGAIKTDLNGNGLPMTVFYRADGSIEATLPIELSQEALDEHLDAISP